MQEYCEGETFNARCQAHDEVVLMTSAHYGRMRLGRCLTANYGNLGCQLDIRTQFDAWCSGRRTCDVRVSSIIDSLPEDTFPCTRDFRGYLEASYICTKGRYNQCSSSEASSLDLPTPNFDRKFGRTFTNPTHSAPFSVMIIYPL